LRALALHAVAAEVEEGFDLSAFGQGVVLAELDQAVDITRLKRQIKT